MLVTATEVASAIGPDTDPADVNLVRITAEVEAEFCQRTGRTFESAARVEYPESFGKDVVFLSDWPVTALTEVRVDACGLFADDTIEPVADFFVRGNVLVWREGLFPEGTGLVKVSCTSGYAADAIPADIKGAIIDEACARINRGSGEKMASESLGSYSFTRRPDSETPFEKTIRRYRR